MGKYKIRFPLDNRFRRFFLAVQGIGHNQAPPQEIRFRIDTKGMVIFSLPNGGTIRDSGGAIHFSAKNEQASELARKLAEAKWGKSWSATGGEIKCEVATRQPEPAFSSPPKESLKR